MGQSVSCSVVSDSLRPPGTVAHQVALSMEFSRQEYWSGLPFPSPGDLPNPGIEPGSPALQADSSPSEPQKVRSALQTVAAADYLAGIPGLELHR